MTTITIQDVERDIHNTLQRVAVGETFLILQADKPVAEIKPITTPPRFGMPVRKLVDPVDAADPNDKARDFYIRELRAKLEATDLNQYVAIHLDSDDFIVDRWIGKALRALKEKHPAGQ